MQKVPSFGNITLLSHLKPEGQMTLVMNVFEGFSRNEVLLWVEERLDPLQFAYRPGRGEEHAGLTLLHFLSLH